MKRVMKQKVRRHRADSKETSGSPVAGRARQERLIGRAERLISSIERRLPEVGAVRLQRQSL